MVGVDSLTSARVFEAWGRHLKARRHEARRSQTDVAQGAGLDQATISAIERGRASFDSILAVARVLQVSLAELVAALDNENGGTGPADGPTIEQARAS